MNKSDNKVINKSTSSLNSVDSIRDTSSDITLDQTSANSGYSTSSSSLVTSTSNDSVLPPIPVSDARNRTFLVGSVGTNVCPILLIKFVFFFVLLMIYCFNQRIHCLVEKKC